MHFNFNSVALFSRILISGGIRSNFLPPAIEVCEGYVFTRVCHSVHRGGVPGQVSPGPIHPPDQVHPPTTRYPPGTRYTPPRTRYIPWDQVHPPWTRYLPGPGTPPPKQYMLGDTSNKWAVGIPLECILVNYNGNAGNRYGGGANDNIPSHTSRNYCGRPPFMLMYSV